jgi:hypothetical protein
MRRLPSHSRLTPTPSLSNTMKTFKISNTQDPSCKYVTLSGATVSDWDYLAAQGFSTIPRDAKVGNTQGGTAVCIMLLSSLTRLGFSFTMA